jgi:hypothetical protein
VSATNLIGESGNAGPVSVQPVSLAAMQLGFERTQNQMQFVWPQDHTGWSLQVQTNSMGVGLGTNWEAIPGSKETNQMTFPVDAAVGSSFYRLVYP